tara:strand:- start:451 stop:606 length:156 start_codon:yes stop_codon:yes gene_type:complete
MTLENIARMRIRADLRYLVDMKRFAEALKQGLTEENYRKLKKYIEEQNGKR